MNKITIFENTVLNFSEIWQNLCDRNQKNFLVDEGPDLEKVMIHDQPLISFFKDKNITIETYNLVQKKIDGIEIKKLYNLVPFLSHQQNNLFVQNKNIEKHFGIFVRNSRWHRLFLASNLFQHHKDKSLINYRKCVSDSTQPCNLYINELFLKSFKINNDLFLKQVFNFVLSLPLLLTNEVYSSTGSEYTLQDSFNITHLYEKIFIDIVCETWHEGRCFYPTEKTSRAIICRTPFLIYGAKYFLKNLLSLVFKTFNNFWDESYDNFSGIDRILKINKIIKDIANLSNDEMKKMYQKMQQTLDYNSQIYHSLNDDKIQRCFQ